ncbi:MULTISPECIES: GNAT family N-acetyltransferase [unclassified Nocardia]|uniref:GNAT family N-acetyltransferase n=1 Tax=unclassified Nocardia TaxID=2637762 RepID=UPI001CE48D40|nr:MULTISPECIES: GNAT family N-acetyltransferase [unclassified Nocardia]
MRAESLAAAVLSDATGAAERAAARAGVVVRSLTEMADLVEACRLCETMWGFAPEDRPLAPNLLRALSKSDGYVAGAFDGAEMVGVGVGFHAAPPRLLLHSHITGVVDRMRGRGVGFALKTHQRAWALRNGVETIGWTFDPLVRRNAYFNIVKLGAIPVEYLPDFYGPMSDAVNAGDATDRLLVRWRLRAPEVAAACDGRPTGIGAASAATAARDNYPAPKPVVALGISADGGPVTGSVDGRTVLVAVPPDITGLRAADPAVARSWRAAVRAVMTELLNDGARITGFDRDGGYLLTKENG